MSLNADRRLSRSIQIRQPAERLNAILAMLQQRAGVKLEASAPMGDTVLIARFDGTLREWMSALTQFFAVSKEERPTWTHFGPAGRWRWRLERGLTTQQEAGRLRQEQGEHLRLRLHALVRAKSLTEQQWRDYALRDPQQTAVLREAVTRANWGAQVVWHWASLPPAIQQRILSGGTATFRPEQLARGQDPDQFVQEWLGAGQVTPPTRDSLITFYTTGHGKQRGLFVRLDFGKARPGLATSTGIAAYQLFEDMSRHDQRLEWRQWFGVEATAPDDRIEYPDPGNGSRRTNIPFVRSELWDIAVKWGQNLIAEDYGWRYRGMSMRGKLTMSDVLDWLCNAPTVTTSREDGSSYVWWRSDGIYMLRSLTWPEDELLNVPYQAVQGWKASRKRNGYLQIDDLAEMAALNRDSLPILTAWFPEAMYLPAAQGPLRWYQHAAPAVRQRAQTPAGVTVLEMGIDPNQAIQEDDPARLAEPVWSSMLRRYAPGDLRVSYIYGKHLTGPAGPEEWGLGVILHEPTNGFNPERQRVLIVPLTPYRKE